MLAEQSCVFSTLESQRYEAEGLGATYNKHYPSIPLPSFYVLTRYLQLVKVAHTRYR